MTDAQDTGPGPGNPHGDRTAGSPPRTPAHLDHSHRRGTHRWRTGDQRPAPARADGHRQLQDRRWTSGRQDHDQVQGCRHRHGHCHRPVPGSFVDHRDGRTDQGLEGACWLRTPASGWCGPRSPAAASRDSARCCPAPTSAWMLASRRRAAAPSWAWRRPPLSRAACRAGSSCSIPNNWGPSVSAHRSTFAASAWARWSPMPSTRAAGPSR